MTENQPIKPVALSESKLFNPVVVPDNIYSGKITDLKTFSGMYGETLVITFTISKGDQEGKNIDGISNLTKMTKKTKLYRWAQALGCKVPELPGESFDPNELNGMEGRILTGQREKTDQEGKKFFQSYVKDILPKE